jgi:hypothetical protein
MFDFLFGVDRFFVLPRGGVELSTLKCLADVSLSMLMPSHGTGERLEVYELTQCSSDCLIESVVAYCHLLGIGLKLSALQESDIAELLSSLSTIAQNARLDGVRLACPRGLLRDKVRSCILKLWAAP